MDKYIPLADRTKGTQLAAQLERSATSERQRLASVAAGLAPDTATGATGGSRLPSRTPARQPRSQCALQASASTIQTTSLPPSNANGTVIPRVPSSPTSTAASAGVDFGTMGSPSIGSPAPAPAPSRACAGLASVASTAAPAVAATGDWRVQLGAFSDEGRARTLWSGLERQNASLTGLQPYLVKAGAVTKLQAGPFASQAAAKQVCDAVAKSGQACFAVKR